MEVFYSFVLCLYLTFVLAAADFQLAGISTDGGSKESGREEVHTIKSPHCESLQLTLKPLPLATLACWTLH
jgi:hypothetical protein